MFGQDKKPTITPKDFFLFIAGMAALYVSAVSLLALLFEYINRLFPDALQYYGDPYSGGIRMAMASLIIIFPLYIYLTRVTNEDLRKNSEKREAGIRKWLLYLTLFVAGATIVVDLIVLLNTFLGGELTTRFVLKVVAVLVVAGAVFGYYREDLRGRWERDEKTSKMIGAIVSLLVLISIVSGFFILGSPQAQRLMRFDDQKVSDLQSIQWQVLNYWERTGELPQTLEALEDPLLGYIVPRDQQTDAEYEYSATGNLSFELCATFNRESLSRRDTTHTSVARPIGPRFDPESENWTHSAGRTCFERTIDPELYPSKRVDTTTVPPVPAL